MQFDNNQQTKFMRLAMEQVEKAIARKGNPWGAVLVSADGEVLAAANNTSTPHTDIVRHAELNLLRIANEKLGARSSLTVPYL